MKKVTIYLSQDKKSIQTITPTEKFDGKWKELVEAVTGGYHYGYKVV